ALAGEAQRLFARAAPVQVVDAPKLCDVEHADGQLLAARPRSPDRPLERRLELRGPDQPPRGRASGHRGQAGSPGSHRWAIPLIATRWIGRRCPRDVSEDTDRRAENHSLVAAAAYPGFGSRAFAMSALRVLSDVVSTQAAAASGPTRNAASTETMRW